MRRLFSNACLLAFACLVLLTSKALAANAGSDFSHTTNPIGVWRYGYETNSVFHLMPNSTAVQVHTNVWFWQGRPGGTGFGEPTVGKNEGTNSWVINGTTTYNPGDFALHPGPTGELAVVRWTAPSNGTFAVIASFKGADANTSTDVHVFVAGSEVWNAIVTGTSTPQGCSFYTTVSSNQVIDFKVGRNGSYTFDTTVTTITVSPSSTCWDAAADFSHTSNPNGQWQYGREVSGTYSLINSGGATLVHSSPDVYFWEGGDGYIGEPTVGKNVGNSSWVIAGTTTYEAGDFGLHPGPNGERAVVRWTAPSAGTYHVFASFMAGDPSNTSDAMIKSGATTLMSLGSIPKTYDATLTLSANQTIDFSVGWGPNNDYLYDTTITVITVCPVP